MKGFALTMLALQSAAEGNASHQCELLFRTFNAAGNGLLSQAEFGRWLAMLLDNELAASAFETDAIVDRCAHFLRCCAFLFIFLDFLKIDRRPGAATLPPLFYCII
jgi:hypothetical protein